MCQFRSNHQKQKQASQITVKEKLVFKEKTPSREIRGLQNIRKGLCSHRQEWATTRYQVKNTRSSWSTQTGAAKGKEDKSTWIWKTLQAHQSPPSTSKKPTADCRQPPSVHTVRRYWGEALHPAAFKWGIFTLKSLQKKITSTCSEHTSLAHISNLFPNKVLFWGTHIIQE